MSYTIGELAKKFNIAALCTSLLRKGRAHPRREKKGFGCTRIWAKDCEVLLLIDCLKQSGMSIKEISHFIELLHAGERTLEDRADILSDLEVKFKEELKRQKQTLKRLQYENWGLPTGCPSRKYRSGWRAAVGFNAQETAQDKEENRSNLPSWRNVLIINSKLKWKSSLQQKIFAKKRSTI